MKKDDSIGVTPFGYDYRIPFHEVLQLFPWYSMTKSYWHLHHPLQLLSAAGMSFGYGDFSRFSCFIFGILQLIFVLRYMSIYNNHEYMYSTMAIALGLCDGHVSHYSPLFIGQFHKSKSSVCYLSMMLILFGVGYMMLWNVVYGIPGEIGLLGMSALFTAVVLTVSDHTEAMRVAADCDCQDAGDARPVPTIPRWNMWLAKVFVCVVYFYAGVAKLEEDWLGGNTVRELFRAWIGPTAVTSLINKGLELDWPVFAIVYAGLGLDLFVSFGLHASNRYIKGLFASAAIGFHLMNHFTFVIETFPWVMIASMALFFDHFWIDFLGNRLEEILLNRFAVDFFVGVRSVLRKFVVPIVATVFILAHIIVPLPCAVYAPLSQDLCWYSQCQFFSWRMMTRSVKMFGLFINLQHPISRQLDTVAVSTFKIDESEVSTIATYEDYLYDLAMHIKFAADSSVNVEYAPPIVTADVWLQINGPPIQRFVDPAVDLTSVHIQKGQITNILSTFFDKPAPLAPWVEPRIMAYRTPQWKERMLNLTKSQTRHFEEKRQQEGGGAEGGQIEVMFFADRAGESRILPLFFQEPTLLRVLDGIVAVAGVSGILQAGVCAEVQGAVIASVNTGSALWMVTDVNHKVMVMKRSTIMAKRMEQPIVTRVRCDNDNDNILRSRSKNQPSYVTRVGGEL
jgi:vitamin K-dependent gamma-carboxylase